jgi:hypothetical protein
LGSTRPIIALTSPAIAPIVIAVVAISGSRAPIIVIVVVIVVIRGVWHRILMPVPILVIIAGIWGAGHSIIGGQTMVAHFTANQKSDQGYGPG